LKFGKEGRGMGGCQVCEERDVSIFCLLEGENFVRTSCE
jgi:hypothetical protein